MKKIAIAAAALFAIYAIYNLSTRGHDSKYDKMYEPPDELKGRTINDVAMYTGMVDVSFQNNISKTVVLFEDCIDHNNVAGKLHDGDYVDVIKQCGDYVFVKSKKNDIKGWCHEGFIKK